MNQLDTVSGRVKPPPSILDYVLIPLTLLLGCASLICTMIFICWGPLDFVNLGLGEASALALNTFLSLGFFVQHSGMIRRSFRRWSGQFIEEKYHGALYPVFSSVCLLLIVVFWQQSKLFACVRTRPSPLVTSSSILLVRWRSYVGSVVIGQI
ncbi:hypothetical protein ACFL2Q_09340 [Thermodesulfobacteriota bacterium]